MELRTARANGIPHGALRFGRSPKRWTERDRTLAIALTMYEDGLCGKCGQPRDRAWNGDMEGWYVAHRATCQACRAMALDLDRTQLADGEQVYVMDETPPDFEPDPRQAHRAD